MTNFDLRAKDWDADPAKVERALVVADAIAAEVPLSPATSLFEYGCGTGLLGFALRERVGRVTLADTSREMLNVLEKKIAATGATNMTPVELDLLTSAVPKAHHDVVCTLMTLHHIDDTDAILAGFHTVLSPGGYLCISDLDEEDGSFHGAGFLGHRGFPRGSLGTRLERAGFRNVRFSTVYKVVKDTVTGRRIFPLFLAVAQKSVAHEAGT